LFFGKKSLPAAFASRSIGKSENKLKIFLWLIGFSSGYTGCSVWESLSRNRQEINAVKYYRSATGIPAGGEGAEPMSFARICQENFIQPRGI